MTATHFRSVTKLKLVENRKYVYKKTVEIWHKAHKSTVSNF